MTQTANPFEEARQIDKSGNEYWSARDLQTLLEYSAWQKFTAVINKAKIACEQSGYPVAGHFNHTVKMIIIGSGAQREQEKEGYLKPDTKPNGIAI